MLVLLCLTLPFLLLGGGLLIAFRQVGGIDGYDYLLYALATGALWILTVLGYLLCLAIGRLVRQGP